MPVGACVGAGGGLESASEMALAEVVLRRGEEIKGQDGRRGALLAGRSL